MAMFHVPAGRNAAALLEIERIRFAINRANGFVDDAGNPVLRTYWLVSGFCTVDRDSEGFVTRVHGNVHDSNTRYYKCTSDSDVIVGDDGTAALRLADELDEISSILGKTVRGVAIPSRTSLVSEASLPSRVKAEWDRRRNVEAIEKAVGISKLR